MPPKKRRYVPKVKGCHQCSRRRIHCDRTIPQCQKCASRGLECAGLGIRLRFYKGCIPEEQQEDDNVHSDRESNQSPPMYDLTEQDTTAIQLNSPAELAIPGDLVSETSSSESHNSVHQILEAIDSSISYEPELSPATVDIYAAMRRPHDILIRLQPRFTNTILYEPVFDGLSSLQNEFLIYFSQNICPEMVFVDGTHNGWRTLVLPLARQDGLVRDAVLSVSSFHIRRNRSPISLLQRSGSSQRNGLIPDSYQLHERVIRGLQQLTELDLCDHDRRQSTLITILVLLVGVMVTGYSDYPILFRMIESALDAIGGDQSLSNGDIGEFIGLQFAKLKVYGAPLVSEDRGFEILSSKDHVSKLMTCLCRHSSPFPRHSLQYTKITDLIQQASMIYLDEVSKISPSFENSIREESAVSIARVQCFKNTLANISPEDPGYRVTIWAAFVAAASCIRDEDKEFFESFLLKHYMRNGFANILGGLELLREIWTRQSGARWTSLVSEAKILVM